MSSIYFEKVVPDIVTDSDDITNQTDTSTDESVCKIYVTSKNVKNIQLNVSDSTLLGCDTIEADDMRVRNIGDLILYSYKGK